jgi:hypothetical protein
MAPSKIRVVNHHYRPVSLEDGTILAAVGTEGAERALDSISERDRKRLVNRGLIAVYDLPGNPDIGGPEVVGGGAVGQESATVKPRKEKQ